jgi:hypothetical protein
VSRSNEDRWIANRRKLTTLTYRVDSDDWMLNNMASGRFQEGSITRKRRPDASGAPCHRDRTLNSVQLESGPPQKLTGRAGAPWPASVRLAPSCTLVPELTGRAGAPKASIRCIKTVKNTFEKSRVPTPSLPLKLHLLHKYTNTAKCTSPCACVLTFSVIILKEVG